ncbi:TetR/AcrR family transcriptional regulator [Vibrio marisflavi]|uniref:HTH-type transcriptional regulator BetI n=1 Tax=Vibrio marisflavi CECT 7928 TaxID=634439 RepID=A0ABM9A361_9VIBR|nr:TetR/AcrR family transcriptional regulator [Vibrio marisflavi]CAH0539116.1 HTH-type transcriptional regulator BetI [Vibrio marisflavi CECT 7928]
MKAQPKKKERDSKTHRDNILRAAQELFTALDYDRVSMRMIAKQSGASSSVIYHYFGNKEGLFESVVRETVLPIQEHLKVIVHKNADQDLISLIKALFRAISEVPNFPKLVIQVMKMPSTNFQRKIVQDMFEEFSRPMQNIIFDKLQREGAIRSDMDPKWCRLSWMSLLIFPLMLPKSIYDLHGFEDENFLEYLLEHNLKVMRHGFICK